MLYVACFQPAARCQESRRDTLIAKFESGDLACQDAVDSFRTYFRAHPNDTMAGYYAGRAMTNMGIIGRDCCKSDSLPPQLDSAISYFEFVRKMDSSFIDQSGLSITYWIGYTYNFKALWHLYKRDIPGLKADLLLSYRAGAITKPQIAYSRTILNMLPPNTIYFGYSDNDFIPLLYVQLFEGTRTDVNLLLFPLLEIPWYAHIVNDGIPNVFPAVPFVQVLGTSDTTKHIPLEERIELEQVGSSMLPSEYPVDSSIHQELETALGHTISYGIVTNAFHASDDGSGVLSDVFGRILHSNEWRRPVYFSERIAEKGIFRNLPPYLRQEGFAERLFPDSGAGYTEYSKAKKMWLDTTIYLRAVDSALALLPYADSIVAKDLSYFFLGNTIDVYLARLLGFVPSKKINDNPDTAAMIKYIVRLHPLARSSEDNAHSQWAMLAIPLGLHRDEFNDDIKWIRTIIERKVWAAGADTTYGTQQVIYILSLTLNNECDLLKKYDNFLKPPSNEKAKTIYDALHAMILVAINECR